MPRRYKTQEVVMVLQHLGWYVVSQEGSHLQFRHPTRRGRVTVALSSREVPPGTLGSIIKQAKLTRKEFEEMAKEVL